MKATKIILIIALVLALAWLVYKPDFEPAITSLTIFISVIGVFVTNKVKAKIGSTVVTISSSSELTKHWDHLRYSFIREDYIHPKIIEELQSGLADIGEPVVGINLIEANSSNRFCGNINIISTETHPIVSCAADGTIIRYQYIATSKSGIHILHTFESGGGSGVFHRVLFLTVEQDEGINFEDGKVVKKDRIVIRSLGSISLGDRYQGNILYKKNTLYIDKDTKEFGETAINKKLKIRVK